MLVVKRYKSIIVVSSFWSQYIAYFKFKGSFTYYVSQFLVILDPPPPLSAFYISE